MKSKKEVVYLAVIVILIGLCGQFYYSYHYKPTLEREVKVYYNHDIQGNEQIINAIQNADKFVYFAIYTFTRTDIKDALLGAKHRGLEVVGITDKDQTNQNDIQAKIVKELRDAGIPMETQDHSGLMHIKTVVTDKSYVSGSYNWTKAATDTNDEVLEAGNDNSVRSQYEKVMREVLAKYKDSSK